MQEGLNNNQTPANNINTPVVPQKENEQKLKIVQTDEGQKMTFIDVQSVVQQKYL